MEAENVGIHLPVENSHGYPQGEKSTHGPVAFLDTPEGAKPEDTLIFRLLVSWIMIELNFHVLRLSACKFNFLIPLISPNCMAHTHKYYC